ncbi:MAG TPA: DNA-binding transcriptional regulator Fis [Candidatus Competibacter sp.]|nr:DNA-binding transcriptional regulator Fis [Candidatus Competibacter sp.]
MNIHHSDPQVDLLPATPLRDHVYETLRIYFHNLGGQAPSNLYDLVQREVEPPLLEIVMQFTGGNQTKAAAILGLNRGTLRKKLRQYGLDKSIERMEKA